MHDAILPNWLKIVTMVPRELVKEWVLELQPYLAELGNDEDAVASGNWKPPAMLYVSPPAWFVYRVMEWAAANAKLKRHSHTCTDGEFPCPVSTRLAALETENHRLHSELTH